MAQVAIKRCSDYNPENVQQAVNEAVVLLGGIEKFVRPGQKVLIKPNMLSARPPESGVCTHPEVARAVIKLVKRVTGSVYVGDSHGGFDVINMDNVYEASGIKKICQEEGVELGAERDSEDQGGEPHPSVALGAPPIGVEHKEPHGHHRRVERGHMGVEEDPRHGHQRPAREEPRDAAESLRHEHVHQPDEHRDEDHCGQAHGGRRRQPLPLL